MATEANLSLMTENHYLTNNVEMRVRFEDILFRYVDLKENVLEPLGLDIPEEICGELMRKRGYRW